MKIQRAVISGATGAVGMALIQECIQREMEVLVLCREGSCHRKRIPEHPLLHVIYCNMEKMAELKDGWDGSYDIFYHLAWGGTTGADRNDMYLQNRNVKYTLDAVHLAARMGCHTFIGAGSQAEYGRVNEKLSGKTSVKPETGYGMAKLCAGQMSREEAGRLGMRHIWARILSVYGPYDGEGSMISLLIHTLLKGEIPSLTPGEQKWDYLYSKDAARAMLLLGEGGIHGKVYCIGSGAARPLKEYMYLLRDAIDPSLKLGIGKKPYGDRQVMYLCADISELTKDTGFQPEVSFETGIRETIRWIIQEKKSSSC